VVVVGRSTKPRAAFCSVPLSARRDAGASTFATLCNARHRVTATNWKTPSIVHGGCFVAAEAEVENDTVDVSDDHCT